MLLGNILQVTKTIQGEGPNIGKPTTLIRFEGCNLKCPMCDTKYAWTTSDIKNKYPVNIHNDQLRTLVDNTFHNDLNENVMITGGEPFLSTALLTDLCNRLHDVDNIKLIEIETNGTLIENRYEFAHDDKIKLNISPKLDPICYTKDKTKNQIIGMYKQLEKKLDKRLRGVNRLYKIVYQKDIEYDILRFINQVSSNVIIMPLTPDKNKFEDESNFLNGFQSSCHDAIEFCIRENLRYTPREHVWVFGDNMNEAESM